jgi:hypothetical protein
MNSAQKENGLAHSKGAKEARARNGQEHTILERIKEVRGKCGDGVKMLPVVRYERKLWFFDERLRQLRNIWDPYDFIDLNEFEVEYFKRRGI